jgi:hypothetical protein
MKRFSEIVGKIAEARIYLHAFNHNNKLLKNISALHLQKIPKYIPLFSKKYSSFETIPLLFLLFFFL